MFFKSTVGNTIYSEITISENGETKNQEIGTVSKYVEIINESFLYFNDILLVTKMP